MAMPARAAETGPALDRSAGASIGTSLYGLIEAYASLGDHRTGTVVDAATIAWFADELQRRGARVGRQAFSFPRYDASSQVLIGGQPVPSLPLYYEGTYEGVGDLSDDHPFVAQVPVMDADRTSKALLDVIAQAKAAGARVAVVATTSPIGELLTPNRFPVPGSGLPVVLVPGRVGAALLAGPVSVRFAGRVVPGQSENVVASFGDVSHAPIVINLPLSGWFTCAAERGTGLALGLMLAERLAQRLPPGRGVLVVGTPGHELLHHIGLEAFLQRNQNLKAAAPALVIHMGANVALGRKDAAGRMVFVDSRAVGVRTDAATFAQLRPALERLGVAPRLNPPKWVGEGELWADAGDAPLMSFVGNGPPFHTPADTPENTTSPELLQQAFEAISGALDAWLRVAAVAPLAPVAAVFAPAPPAAPASAAAALLGQLRPRVEPYSAAQIDAISAKAGLTTCFWVGTVNPQTFNIAYPDSGVTYWAAQYRLPPGAQVSLHGRYPHARHISINSYDAQGQPVDRLNDLLIEPAAGSVNPFLPGAARLGAERAYGVRFMARQVEAGKPVDDGTREPSTLYVPPGDGLVQLWYRVYVPDQGVDATGGVGLPVPTLTLADGRTLEGEALCHEVVVKDGAVRDVRIPPEALKPLLALPNRAPYPPAQPQPRWNAFFNPALAAASLLIGTEYEPLRAKLDTTRRGGFYSTLDNTYMAMYVDARYGEVLVLRGKAPSTPRTQQGAAVMAPADLRYWSICKYRSLADTAVDACVFDEQVPRDADGAITVLISKPASRPANARTECGVAWLPWGVGDGLGNADGGFVLLRHMLPSAEFRRHSIFGTRQPGDEAETLGPYYPQPTYMSRAEFEKRGCTR